jgi:protein-S-isoprenylcysteine O-methyltransferase Ste14
MTWLPALGPRGEGWVLVQGILLVLVAAAGWSLGPDWTGVPQLAGAIAGIAMVLGGVLLFIRGVVDLGGAMTPLPKPRADGELVDTGAYALVRHPIYGGLIIAAFGWALLRASVMAIALAALLAVFFRLKSAREEGWLEKRYPGYAAYRGRTRRFIPWIGRSRG